MSNSASVGSLEKAFLRRVFLKKQVGGGALEPGHSVSSSAFFILSFFFRFSRFSFFSQWLET